MASAAQLCPVATKSLAFTHATGCSAGPSSNAKQVLISRSLDGTVCRAGGTALRLLAPKESSGRRSYPAQSLTPVCESAQSAAEDVPSVSRRSLLSAGAGLALSVSALGVSSPASAVDIDLEEWEKVELPLEPGVVLLDVAFVPNDPKHGGYARLSFGVLEDIATFRNHL